MAVRKIIDINEEKCNGCGLCIPDCPEGALQIIDGKARLVSDLFCDGLGACLGSCPKGAIRIIERQAEPYQERKVMERMVKQGKNVIRAHLEHLKEHGEEGFLKEAVDYLEEKGIENPLEEVSVPHACPGARTMDLRRGGSSGAMQHSELRQWPIQLSLLPPTAPFFDGADLLISADCVGFASPNFHAELLKGKLLVIGCPKLDDIGKYKEKIRSIVGSNGLKSITVAIMEVPCCYGLYKITEDAVKGSGKDVPIEKKVIRISRN